MPHYPTDVDRSLTQVVSIEVEPPDLPGIMGQVADFARQSIAGTGDVSITILGADGAYTAAFTSDLALRLDEAQYQLRTGPCLQAAAERATVLVRDTRQDIRWSPWPSDAAAAGAGCIMSIGLSILADVNGALNVYGRIPGAFDDDAVHDAQVFARHACVTLANAYLHDRTAKLAHQMRLAMSNRAVIEQAKGIIMAERRCTADQAFATLTKLSQNSNRKVRDIAAAIVARTHAG
jgi:ANTAR domain-containing protein/GAF domain-containing protein